MADKNWVLTDVERGVWHGDFSVSPRTPQFPDAANWFPNQSGWSVGRRTLRGGLSEGVDVIDVNNGRLSFSVLPTRGMGLWQGSLHGINLGWASPARNPVNPAFVNQIERGGLGWLVGFNEWLCRCGLDSNGPPGKDVIINNQGNKSESELTLHGKIANIPAHYVEVSITPGPNGKLSVTGIVDEAMLFGPCLRLKTTYETVIGSNQLTVIDEVTNLRAVPAELELLYHINMGKPLLEEGAQFVAPALEVAPRDARAVEGIKSYSTYAAPMTGYVEQVYFFDLLADAQGKTSVLLRNSAGDKGLSLHFDKRQLPCFTLWKNTQAEADGYVTGLEPATNYPNLKTFEREKGRVITLPPGGSHQTRIDMQVHDTHQSVQQVEHHIVGLQQERATKVHDRPQPRFSPGA
jgi:hypothetical protein